MADCVAAEAIAWLGCARAPEVTTPELVDGAPLVAGERELLAPEAATELAALELLAATEEAEALWGEPRTALRPEAACEADCAAALMDWLLFTARACELGTLALAAVADGESELLKPEAAGELAED